MGSPRPLNKKQILDALAKTKDLSDADMRGIDLVGVVFDGANLQRAKLAECNLGRASFRGADLTNASLWHADCKDAVFDGAILEEADLDFAYLDGCTFKDARVRKAIFPFNRLPLQQVLTSVRTGRKVRMDAARGDD